MKQFSFFILCFWAVTSFLISEKAQSQNVGIGTTTPQATLDVKGNQRIGGLSSYVTFDSATGRMEWKNTNLYVPVSQALMKHSAAGDGLFYNNTVPTSGQLEYRNALGEPVFYSNFTNGNGYFKNFLGIGITSPGAKLHIVNGSSGYNSGYFPGAIIEGSTNTYLNLLTPDLSESAVLFGNASDAASGGIVYNNVSNLNGLQFRTNGNANRMVITNTGNMGIGNLNPSEKLQVSGNIKADSFKYATPKTLFYNLSGSDFRGFLSRDTTTVSLGSGSIFMGNTAATNGIVAPVHLPHGAKMINITYYLEDFSAPQNLQTVFYRKTILSNFFPENIGVVNSSGSAGLAAYTTPVNFFSNIVDNTLYTYYLNVYTTPFPSAWSSSALGLRAVIIEYTLSEAQ